MIAYEQTKKIVILKSSHKNYLCEYNYLEKGQDKCPFKAQRRGRICGKHLEKKKLKEN